MTFANLEMSALSLALVQIGVVLLISRTLAFGFRALRQPLVIAEIVAGIVLGPSVLGSLWPEALSALFPASSLPLLRDLSQIGLVLFMFLVGLELDLDVLKGCVRHSAVISFSSILLPFLLGVGIGAWLYPTYSSSEVPRLSFLLFFGVAMSITAFPVLARILSERRLSSSRIGALTLACAAVDDVSAWCILALVVAVARARGVGAALGTAVMAVAFVLVMFGVVRPALKRMGQRVVRRGGPTAAVTAVTLGLLLLVSSASDVIGIHSVFGAFLFGVILPREHAWASTLAAKLETVAVVLLVPVFFACSGLRTDIGLLGQTADWLVAVAVLACATLGKFGGSTLAARLTGLRWREASAVGILMNTRGLMELVVLNIGIDLGVISPTVFTMLVFMALITTAATTPLLRWIYPDHVMSRAPGAASEPLTPALPTST